MRLTKENKKKERKCAESVPEEEIMLGMLAKEGKIAVIRVYVTSPPVFSKESCQLKNHRVEEERGAPIHACTAYQIIAISARLSIGHSAPRTPNARTKKRNGTKKVSSIPRDGAV